MLNLLFQHSTGLANEVHEIKNMHKPKIFRVWSATLPTKIVCLFVKEEILVTVSRRAPAFKEAWPSPYHY